MNQFSIEKTILNAEPSSTTHLIKKLIEQTICPICQDHMFVPFMTKCGHNFCYECITSWLETNLTCPACRGQITEQPYLNIPAQNIMTSLIDTVKSLNNDELPNDFKRDRDMKLHLFKRDVKRNNIFKKIFTNSAHAVIDTSDGVARCSNCHWEVEGNHCPNCHIRLRNPYINSISSPNTTDFEDYYHTEALQTDEDEEEPRRLYGDSEEDEDEDGSFIDDRDLGELEIHEDGLHSSSDESPSSSPVRRHQIGYLPTNLESWEDSLSSENGDYEEWNGFQDEVNRALSRFETDENGHVHTAGDDEDEDDLLNTHRRGRFNIIEDSDEE